LGAHGDNENAMMGDNGDIARYAYWLPRQDTSGYSAHPFGSAHANGFHAAFYDGSVDLIGYGIDPTIHASLCNRRDVYMLDGKKY
jgi:hypothetical protein